MSPNAAPAATQHESPRELHPVFEGEEG